MKATNVSKQESAETILTYKTLQVLTVLEKEELEKFFRSFGEALNISTGS